MEQKNPMDELLWETLKRLAPERIRKLYNFDKNIQNFHNIQNDPAVGFVSKTTHHTTFLEDVREFYEHLSRAVNRIDRVKIEMIGFVRLGDRPGYKRGCVNMLAMVRHRSFQERNSNIHVKTPDHYIGSEFDMPKISLRTNEFIMKMSISLVIATGVSVRDMIEETMENLPPGTKLISIEDNFAQIGLSREYLITFENERLTNVYEVWPKYFRTVEKHPEIPDRIVEKNHLAQIVYLNENGDEVLPKFKD